MRWMAPSCLGADKVSFRDIFGFRFIIVTCAETVTNGHTNAKASPVQPVHYNTDD